MSQALHIGFEPIEYDPARQFLRSAPHMLDIDDLVAAFVHVLAHEGGTAHRCSAIDCDAQPILLIEAPPGADNVLRNDPIVTFSIEMYDDESLIVAVATPEPPDRDRKARLHTLTVVYATHLLTLIEAQDDKLRTGLLTDIERHCLRLMLTGSSYLDIGEELDLSAPAVGIYLRRAAARLGTLSVAEAGAIAAARGLLN